MIINNYSWSEFKSLKGNKVKYATGLVNSETGDTFTALAFENANIKDNLGRPQVCFVSFSKKLGTLTPNQLASQVSDLQIVEDENHRFTLCHKGEGNGGWEVLDF